MKCVFCGYNDSKVLDSRDTDDGKSIRRRRECLNCGKRFTTYETVVTTPLLVIKNDSSRQPFNKNKIINGLIKACEKRPVSLIQIQEVADNIEKQLYNFDEQEITSQKIGELVMQNLKNLDDVAYIRFASVYKQFKDIDSFKQIINNIN